MKKLKVVFMGTPGIACGFLSRLAADGHHIAGVISQPDRPQGRGMKLCCPPIKDHAAGLALSVFQPATHGELAGVLAELKPDICVVVAYGRLIKKDALALANIGFLNVHFSLLPKYRGAAPVQWALINGDESTGVTVFWLDEGMDTGPVCAERIVPIYGTDSATELFARASAAGEQLLSECLERISAGEVIKVPQTGTASLAPKIKTEDSWIDFSWPADMVYNRVRGLACGPRARFAALTQSGGRVTVQILKASVAAPARGGNSALPGSITAIESGKGFFIKCSGGEVLVEEVQPEGRKAMSAFDFANGLRLKAGDIVSLGR